VPARVRDLQARQVSRNLVGVQHRSTRRRACCRVRISSNGFRSALVAVVRTSLPPSLCVALRCRWVPRVCSLAVVVTREAFARQKTSPVSLLGQLENHFGEGAKCLERGTSRQLLLPEASVFHYRGLCISALWFFGLTHLSAPNRGLWVGIWNNRVQVLGDLFRGCKESLAPWEAD
jgi:hypothetical protein